MNTEKFAIPFAIIIAGGIIGGALYFSNIKAASVAKGANQAPTAQQAAVGDMRKVTSDDHILGNPNADVVIVEYSDTECPYCKMFQTTMKQVIANYGTNGKVAWVYRNFPIDSLHSKSRKEAEATECAAELGGQAKFWEFINGVYDKTPSNNGLDPAQLPIIATSIGLDTAAFNSCLSSGRYAPKVEADYQDGVKAGATGTPHSVIITKDGKTPIDGAKTYDQMKTIIDALLK